MTRALVFFGLLMGCGDKGEESGFLGGGGSLNGDDSAGDDSAGDDTGGSDSDPLQQVCASGETGDATTTDAVVLTGEVSWVLEFDEEAEANGFVDCSYTRSYQGEQVLEYDYLCPDCDFIVRGEATMTDGLQDCYEPVFGDAEDTRVELWGVGGVAFFRTGADQHPLGELADLDVLSGDGSSVDVAWDSEYDMTDGGTMTLAATGSMAWQTDASTQLDDPWAPREDVYDCGWECEDPGTLSMDYDLAVNSVFPNVRLQDQCGDTVDLWDFYGSYLVIDSSQSDCGPCRSMAAAEDEFIQDMRAQGMPVRVITLLGNGLADSYGTPDESTLQSWVDSNGLTDPVLYDKGFASALFPDFIADYSGEDYGFPVWLVVDPGMQLIHGNVGFGSWDDVADVILTDSMTARP